MRPPPPSPRQPLSRQNPTMTAGGSCGQTFSSPCHAAVASVETARSRQRASSSATKAFFASMRRTASLPNGMRSK